MPVWTWGSDGYGRLGHGTFEKHLPNPTEVNFFSGIPLKTVNCGSAHNILVDTNGRCFTWGKCHYGQLGHGEGNQDETIPRPVSSLNTVRIKSIGAGDSHVLAVTDEGAVYSWGVGFYGCLGHGDEAHSYVPKLIEALSGNCIQHVTGGAYHSIAQDDEGKVFVWGRDNCGQIGQPLMTIPGLAKPIRINQKKPILYKGLPDSDSSTMMSACNNHTLILLKSGRVISLGCNDNGELGRDVDNTIIDPNVFTNSSGQIEQVSYVCAGWKHCAAITESGCLYAWGHGAYGRLGQGHSRDERKPTQVPMPDPAVRFKSVTCGESHTIAMDTDGVIWGCGSGHYGKLGIPLDVVPKLQPIKTKLTNISGVVCGTNHTMAYQL